MLTPPPRTIVHLDADCFFAAVEQASDSKLRGRPVAVGGEICRRCRVGRPALTSDWFSGRTAECELWEESIVLGCTGLVLALSGQGHDED